MNSDIFGNLREWRRVIELLDSLKKCKKLDKHQVGLARILRYGQNWRLLETVLEYGKEIIQPTDEFLQEVYHIMINRNFYLDVRIFAVQTLESLLPLRTKNRIKDQNFCETIVVRKMMDILNSQEPPIFHEVIAKSLEAIRKRQKVGISK